MDTTTESADNIKACRTCGIYFVAPTRHQLKHLFQSCQENSEIMLIRRELAQWNVEISENDGFPQYVCNTCVHKFEKVFELRTACISAQNEFRKLYAVSNENVTNVKIKSEVPDKDEESAICDFIYVDELSDGEYDGATPFNIPHIPIKEEVIEEAAVPIEDSGQTTNVVESASRVVMLSGSSYSHESSFLTQKDSVTTRQNDAMLPLSSDAVECSLCHQICSNLSDRKLHMETVHETRDLECHICGKEFKNCTSARLKFHLKWHTLNKQVKCNFCGFVCHSKDVLSAHKRTNHRKINCKICGKGILAKNMKSHLHQHELHQNYICEYCSKDFPTENERENHIWEIHATEDNSAANSVTNYQKYTHQVSGNTLNVTQKDNMFLEPHENFLYKYICANCERRFIKQIDLEIHVKEEHRGIGFETDTAMVVDTTQIEKASETVENDQDFNDHTIFENYDNDNEILLTNSNQPQINTSILTQEYHVPTLSFVAQKETLHKDQINLGSSSSCDEDYDTIESDNETNNLSTYAEGDLNTFACAKCSETFAAVEQLREHHEEHLSAEQHKPKAFPTDKFKFHCNFCGKWFDLKFRLNRHIKKHKNHVPLK